MSLTDRTGTHDGTGPHSVVVAIPSTSAMIGDRARIRAAVAFARSVGLSSDGLVALDATETELDPATCSRVADQLRRVGQVLRAVPVPAVAWLDADGDIVSGVLGDALTTADGLPVLSGPSNVTAHHDGEHAWLRADGTDLCRWSTRYGRLRADGNPVVELGDAVSVDLLRVLGVPSGRVQVVPATSVLAPLLATGGRLAVAAASAGATLRVAAGPPHE